VRQFISISLWGILASAPLLPQTALAQDSPGQTVTPLQNTIKKPARKVIVEDVPALDNFYRVSADRTPSGYPVPRYVSLKYGEVNGRIGPSRQHPIAWQYRRRGLPLIIVAETEMWRKVRDINGDESWVRKPALSGERFAMAMANTSLRNKPKDNARITAIAEKNTLLKLEECDPRGWCRVKAANGVKGWAARQSLWGAQPLN